MSKITYLLVRLRTCFALFHTELVTPLFIRYFTAGIQHHEPSEEIHKVQTIT